MLLLVVMIEPREPLNRPAKIADSTTVAIDTLQLWDRNPRSIKGDRFNELKERLKRQGQIKPLLVAKDGTTVIGGNMRLRAMQELGIEEVWISQTEAQTDKEIFDLALTDNEEFGYYEQEQVAELALELGLSPLELKSYALSLGEPTTLDLVIDKFGPEDVEEDEVPEVDETEPPVSQLGEVYQLGNHRLMCGDSTDEANVFLLTEGVRPDMVFTDPPYGIDLIKGATGKVGGGTKQYPTSTFTSIIDDDKPYDPTHLLNLSDKLVIWGANYFVELLTNSRCWFMWDKNHVTDRTFCGVEMAWTNLDRHAKIYKSTWDGYTKEGESGSKVHPSQKPVKLCADIIGDVVESGETVLDLFGGSGSTLIACEQTNRTCYMMELDPKYCDVIRKRYAKHIGEEESWQEVTPVIKSSDGSKADTTPELSLTRSSD